MKLLLFVSFIILVALAMAFAVATLALLAATPALVPPASTCVPSPATE